MADFNWYLNKQGSRGVKGDKGDQGYSPYVTYGKNSVNEFTLLVHNENETIETPNLKADLIDTTVNPNGTYVRYDKANKQAYIGDADIATGTRRGEVILSTIDDVVSGTNYEPDFGEDMPAVIPTTVVASKDKALTPEVFVDSLQYLIVTGDGNLKIQQEEDSKTSISLANKVIHKNLFYNSSDAYLIWSDLGDYPNNPINAKRVTTNRGTYGRIYELLYDNNHFSVGSDRKLSINSNILDSINNVVLDVNDIKTTINSLSNKYVTLDTYQTITGTKYFTQPPRLQAGEGLRTEVAKIAELSINNILPTSDNPFDIRPDLILGESSLYYKNILPSNTYKKVQTSSGSYFASDILCQNNIKAGENVAITYDRNGDVTINATGGGSGANIDDTTPSLTKVFSSQHTSDLIGELGNDVVDIGSRLSTAEGKINVNETAITDLDESVDGLSQRVADIEGGSRVNAVIKGSPRILEGQVDGFTANDYLQFPMIFEPKGRKWTAHMKFTTGEDVTTQQNLLDSSCSVAFAIRNGEFVWALSSNGTSFNSGEGSTWGNAAQPNTTYWIEFSHEPNSGDGEALCSVFTSDPKYSYGTHFRGSPLTSSIAPKTILIGGKDHPFKGSIDMREWYLELMSDDGYHRMDTVWEGYAESSGKLDVDLNNINDLGRAVINEMIDVKINEALGAIGTALDDILYGDTN